MYINLPLLILFLLVTITLLSQSAICDSIILNYLNINLNLVRENLHAIDKISLVAISSLFIGVMGTVPGHELVHRKAKNSICS